MYFVTICAHSRKCLFGEIVDGEMQINEYGCVMLKEWLKTADVRKNVELDEFIVMPNHFHGIIVLTDVGARRVAPTEHRHRLASSSIGAIIGQFKSIVTKHINKMWNTLQAPVWQRNYYEHVIRDDESLNLIREYIQTNPLRWELDRENPNRKGKDDFDKWLESLHTKGDPSGRPYK